MSQDRVYTVKVKVAVRAHINMTFCTIYNTELLNQTDKVCKQSVHYIAGNAVIYSIIWHAVGMFVVQGETPFFLFLFGGGMWVKKDAELV